MLRAHRGGPPGPWRCRHPASHLVECAVMLYMFLVLPASAVVRTTAAGMSAAAAGSRLAPRCAALCKIAMGYMLIMTL